MSDRILGDEGPIRGGPPSTREMAAEIGLRADPEVFDPSKADQRRGGTIAKHFKDEMGETLANVKWQQYVQSQGCESAAMPEIEREKIIRQQRVIHATHILGEALKIRADAALMAEVRQVVREQRDELARLLDDV